MNVFFSIDFNFWTLQCPAVIGNNLLTLVATKIMFYSTEVLLIVCKQETRFGVVNYSRLLRVACRGCLTGGKGALRTGVLSRCSASASP